MRHSPIFRTTALASIGVAALALAACNRNGAASSSQNGAYVAGSAPSSLPDSSQGALPPSNEYQQVADTPPPPLPVYDQPPIPAPGYVWTPGYWDWSADDTDYYWVPGTWIEPPDPGLYWTPGYWRFYDGRYLYSDGYWGPQVGFYGGVDYGYGYEGNGYSGGRWQDNRFYYNTQVNNLGGRHFETVYSQDVSAAADNRASYNGGPGGLRITPAPAEIQAAQARHFAPTHGQIELARTARADPQLRASINRGAPPIAATPRPQMLRPGAAGAKIAGVTAARSAGEYTPPPRQGPPPGGPRPPLPAPVSGPPAGGPPHPKGPLNGPLGAKPLEPGGSPAERHQHGPAGFAPGQPIAPKPNAATPIAPQVHETRVREPQVREPEMRNPGFAGPTPHAPQVHAPQVHAPQMAREPAPVHAPPAMRAPPPAAIPHAAAPHPPAPRPTGPKGPEPDRH